MRSLPARSTRRRRRLHRTRLALTVARLRRSTAFTLAAAASAAALTGITTAGMLSDAAAARDRWGDVASVAVVVRDLAPGAVIGPGDVRGEQRPRQLLPHGTLDDEAAIGRVALAPLVAGDVVVEARLGADLLPAGWRAIAIPPPGSGGHPDVAVGDRVEILDVGGLDTMAIAEGIVVAVRAEDGMVTVGVAAEAGPRVAYAAVAGTAVLALTAAPPPQG